MRRVLLTLVAISLIAGCNSTPHDSWTLSLHEALQDATRLHVRSGGTCHREQDAEKTLLDLRDRKQLEELVKLIRIDPREDEGVFHCMCCGEPTLEFFRDDILIVTLGFHHGQSLRWLQGEWVGDGLLTTESAGFLIQWLADHGVPGPKAERDENIRLQKQAEASQERWLKAMPESLKPFWNNTEFGFGPSDNQPQDAALTKQFPDQNARILALLSWYGAGAGPWSGYPSYEMLSEELLLLHQTDVILAAIQNQKLTEQQTEGLARLLAGWDFSQQRPDDLRLVPAELKARLLKHSLRSEDEDKRRRAQRAFAAN